MVKISKILLGEINTDIIAGQHYRGRLLTPGRRYRMDGVCFGLVLSWIKAIHSRRDLEAIPSISEGKILQLKFWTEFSTRSEAISMDEEEAESSFPAGKNNDKPEDYELDANNPFWLSSGFILKKKCGVLSAFNILRLLNVKSFEEKIRTYEIGGAGHSIGVGIDGKSFVFFDSNQYIKKFTKSEAIYNCAFMHEINNALYPARKFYMTEIAY